MRWRRQRPWTRVRLVSVVSGWIVPWVFYFGGGNDVWVFAVIPPVVLLTVESVYDEREKDSSG